MTTSSDNSDTDLQVENQVETPSTTATTGDKPEFGWSSYAERVNGRFAMIGFLSILIVELISNDSFLHWSGLIN